MSYAWIITRDFDPDDDAPEGTNLNAKGVAGPRDATPEQIEKARTEGYLFRLVDGDERVIYHGRIWVEGGEDPTAKQITLNPGDDPMHVTYGPGGGEEEDFGPLWDFGTPNYGCTDIQYRCPDPADPSKKVWASL